MQIRCLILDFCLIYGGDFNGKKEETVVKEVNCFYPSTAVANLHHRCLAWSKI